MSEQNQRNQGTKDESRKAPSRDELAGEMPDESGMGRGNFGALTPEERAARAFGEELPQSEGELSNETLPTRGQQGGTERPVEGEPRGSMPGRPEAIDEAEEPDADVDLGRTTSRAQKAARDEKGDGNSAGHGMGRHPGSRSQPGPKK